MHHQEEKVSQDDLRRPAQKTSTKDQHKSGFGERVKDEFAEARKPS